MSEQTAGRNYEIFGGREVRDGERFQSCVEDNLPSQRRVLASAQSNSAAKQGAPAPKSLISTKPRGGGGPSLQQPSDETSRMKAPNKRLHQSASSSRLPSAPKPKNLFKKSNTGVLQVGGANAITSSSRTGPPKNPGGFSPAPRPQPPNRINKGKQSGVFPGTTSSAAASSAAGLSVVGGDQNFASVVGGDHGQVGM